MAIFCGKCGSKVGVIGACKTCKKEQAAKDKAGAEAYRTNFRANASAGDKAAMWWGEAMNEVKVSK
jgi:hypothetical protein